MDGYGVESRAARLRRRQPSRRLVGSRARGRWCSGRGTRGCSCAGLPRHLPLIAARRDPGDASRFRSRRGRRRFRSSRARRPRPCPTCEWQRRLGDLLFELDAAASAARARRLRAGAGRSRPGACPPPTRRGCAPGWAAVALGRTAADEALALLRPRRWPAATASVTTLSNRALALETLGRTGRGRRGLGRAWRAAPRARRSKRGARARQRELAGTLEPGRRVERGAQRRIVRAVSGRSDRPGWRACARVLVVPEARCRVIPVPVAPSKGRRSPPGEIDAGAVGRRRTRRRAAPPVRPCPASQAARRHPAARPACGQSVASSAAQPVLPSLELGQIEAARRERRRGSPAGLAARGRPARTPLGHRSQPEREPVAADEKHSGPRSWRSRRR